MRGGVRGRKTKVGRKLLRFPPTRFVQWRTGVTASESLQCLFLFLLQIAIDIL